MTDAEVSQLAEKGFFVREDFIARAAALALAARAGQLPLRRAGVGEGGELHGAVRGDEIAWLDRADAVALFDAFEALRAELNSAAYLGLTRFDVQLARYPKGAAYARHRDALRGKSGRRATAIVYLNEHWTPPDGGQLRLFASDGTTLDLEPTLARLVVFLSERLDHEVLRANAERLAATAWFYGP